MKLCSIISVGYFISFIGAVIANKDLDNEAKSIIEQLDSTTGSHLNSRLTLKLLKKLSENYSSRSNIIFEKKNKKLKELIEANNITLDKCSIEHFERSEKIIKSNANKSPKVFNYLKEQRNKQFLECKDIFEEQMRLLINGLDGDTKEKMLQLRKTIKATLGSQAKSGERYLVISPDNLKTGVSDYVLKMSKYSRKEFLNEDDGKELFSQEISRIPAPICVRLREKLSRITNLFTPFLYGPESEVIGQFTIDWLENMKICSIILEDVHEFSIESYELMKSRKPNRNIAHRLLSCIFGY